MAERLITRLRFLFLLAEKQNTSLALWPGIINFTMPAGALHGIQMTSLVFRQNKEEFLPICPGQVPHAQGSLLCALP